MADAQVPTPFSQFTFFKSLSFSLYEYDWYNFVETWQSMVEVNAPLPEFNYNLVPFFSNARRLLPVFHRYMNLTKRNPDLLTTMTTVLLSTPLLIRIQDILQSPTLFSAYVVALKMDNPSASHSDVMRSLQSFLDALPGPTRLAIQRAFAEAEASDSMGLSPAALDMAFQILYGDTSLYIDVLKALQMNQSRNMRWEAVVSNIRSLVQARQPRSWTHMNQFLNDLHWGRFHQSYQYPTSTSDASYGDYSYSAYEDEDENDDIVERIEGVDYVPDALEERELGVDSLPSSSSQANAGTGKQVPQSAVAKETHDECAELAIADSFKNLTTADKREVVSTC